MARGAQLSILIVIACLGCQIHAEQDQGISNKNVRVVAVPVWDPFISRTCSNTTNWEWGYECPNGTDTIYYGIMWDVLMMLKKHKNVTITMMDIEDGYWGGTCYDRNNCTGMIGTVNRKEADLALGKCKKYDYLT